MNWEVLTPAHTSAASDTALSIGSDQTVTLLGSGPTTDTYEIVAPTDQNRITAIRLEILPDPTEPPERFIRDLFVLADFQVRASPRTTSSNELNDTRRVFLQQATLQLPHGDISISPTIDADPTTVWRVGPHHDQPGVVIFQTEETRLTAWQSYCRALFCLNEFIYLE